MQQIRILLVEDHALVRASLRAVLEKLANICVVAEAADGREALALVAEQHPTVVVMDVAMARLSGLEALHRMTKEFPKMRVLMLSVHDDKEIIRRALQFGAAGYMLKDASPNELELAIHAVVRGETYLSPHVIGTILTDSFQTGPQEYTDAKEKPDVPPTRLTPRQREILQLVAEGHPSKEIADMLHMKVKTVEVHRAQLMNRLAIHDIAGLVRYAIRHGLILRDK